MRILFWLFIALFIIYLAVLASSMKKSVEKPIFLRIDEVANHHETTIDICVNSVYAPTPAELENLKSDYSNLWAHLNHFYATNDLIAGKEYYTERWFKQHGRYQTEMKKNLVTRKDLFHELNIENWSRDGLLCTAIDRHVTIEYTLPDQQKVIDTMSVAIVLLYQGDHWRIDAMQVLQES